MIKNVSINDKDIRLFEGQYATPNGMAYNSYVILDEKIAVMDTVEASHGEEWLLKVEEALSGRCPDYLVVHHMEPDHSANIKSFLARYPDTEVVATAIAFKMMKGFFGQDFAPKAITVKDGSTLSLGEGTLTFYSAAMIHWPEVAVSYYDKDGILFSADAFGKFGTSDTDEPWADEARRYYIGIVGKYGMQVSALLAKLSGLPVKAIYPLHGPVLTENLVYYINLYSTWASYRPERDGVTVAYSSIYGNTAKGAKLLADKLTDKGIEVRLYDLTRCDMSEAIASAFMYSHLVIASATYNADLFPKTRVFIDGLTERGYCSRTVGLMENGSWAPKANKIMREMLEECAELDFIEPAVTISSALSETSIAAIEALARSIDEDF